MKVNRIATNKFKTNEIAIFLSMPLERENITKNALLPKVLMRGSENFKTQLEISKKLEDMYGASSNCGIDKIGDYCVLKFYIQSIGNKYALNGEEIAQDSINLITDIIFNPYTENNAFNTQYVEQEKENLLKIIESKKDNKSMYAYNRCIEEMFAKEPYSLYKYGYKEDLESINEKNLYEYYKQMLEKCRIEIFINGIDANEIKIPSGLENLGDNFEEKVNNTDINNEEKVKEIKETLDVTQGKLIIGLNANAENKYAVSMYNIVLGGGANSKLFQNVREKQSLAYSASSNYVRRKNAIFIKTGIELANYDKALKVIKEQLEEMKNGNITDNEIEAGKELVIGTLKSIPESQEDTIGFSYDQSLFGDNVTIEEYIENMKNITKEQIVEVAQNITINTIYYLTNE